MQKALLKSKASSHKLHTYKKYMFIIVTSLSSPKELFMRFVKRYVYLAGLLT